MVVTRTRLQIRSTIPRHMIGGPSHQRVSLCVSDGDDQEAWGMAAHESGADDEWVLRVVALVVAVVGLVECVGVGRVVHQGGGDN